MTGRDVVAAAQLAAVAGVLPDARMRQAVVAAVNADGTVDVQVGGSATVIEAVACLESVGAVEGDTVWCAQFGTGNLDDLLVLGRPAPGAWRAYVPTLTASTTNPTLGVGATQEGEWEKTGSTCQVKFNLRFGTSGVAAGSGAYRVGLPLPGRIGVGTAFTPIGQVMLRQDSGQLCPVTATLQSEGDLFCVLRYPATAPFGAPMAVSGSAPWTWAAGDLITGTVEYEIATT